MVLQSGTDVKQIMCYSIRTGFIVVDFPIEYSERRFIDSEGGLNVLGNFTIYQNLPHIVKCNWSIQ